MFEKRKILKINLTEKKIIKEDIPDTLLKRFLGGKGLNIHYLMDLAIPVADPFAEDNPLIFSNGLLTGTPALSSSRIHLGSISPLTGLIGSSNAGGYFGRELFDCGVFSILITGKSDRPVYIYINNKSVEIRDAQFIWGLDTGSAWESLVKNTGIRDLQVAVIGQAGENLVRFASVIFPPNDAAGRTGMGAVMGAKKLKAIAVKSNRARKFHIDEKLKNLIKRQVELIKESKEPDYFRYIKYGDTTYVKWLNQLESGSYFNFRDVAFEKIDTADGEYLDRFRVKTRSCYNCPIRCRAEVEIERSDGLFKGERPDFEPMVLLGPRIGNFNAAQTVYLHTLCNRYGMDSIDTGSIIGFLMDIYDRGIIRKSDLNGLELKWGDVKAAEEIIRQIALRSTEIGDILGRGLKEASELLNRGAEKYAYHVKGLSLPAMDPRGFKASALGYAISTRGADFTSIYARHEYAIDADKAQSLYGTARAADRFSEDGKALMLKKSLVASVVLDSLGLCKITYLSFLDDYGLENQYEAAKLITEWEDFEPGDLLRAGNRIITLERIFNMKRGASSVDDYLPEKFIKEPIKRGAGKGSVVNLEVMKKEFYRIMGWDERGVPKRETLKMLDLEDEARFLEI